MLHPYVESVWSFGYIFSWEIIHYWLEYARKKRKKIVHSSLCHSPLGMCMDVPVYFIEFVLERVCMGVSFLDSILIYILGEGMSRLFDFCEKDERPFFSISRSLLYPLFHLFRMWLLSMLWCKLTITHFSIFILFLHFTLPHLISFFSHPVWCLTWV